MSDEQSNQPRKVKDLKARLGRTIAPQTPGAAMPAGIPVPATPGGGLPPPGVPGLPAPAAAAPAAAPAGDAGAAPPPAAAGGVVPPPNLPAPPLPTGGNPLAAPLPGPKAVVEPPWVKQQREEEAKRKIEDEKRKKRAAADPFATAEAPAGGAARLVVGEVDEATLNEALAKQRKQYFGMMAGGFALVAIIFLFVGKAVGGNMAARGSHNRGVDAAENLNRTVARGDAALQAAKTQVDKMVAAADPRHANPHVDYDALSALQSVENPFRAEHFVETYYVVFDANTVDMLLKYYGKTRELFDAVSRLGNLYMIRNPEGRRALDASFQAATDIAKMPAGCVPVQVGTAPAVRTVCNMVFVDLEHPAADNSGFPTRPRPTAAATNRTAFAGTTLAEMFDKVFIPVNFETSRDVMGSTLHLHDRFMRDLMLVKAAIDEAMNARTAFRNELTRIAALPRQWTF